MPYDPTRRTFLAHTANVGAAVAASRLGLSPQTLAAESPDAHATAIAAIKDPDIRAGLQAAIEKNILPAAVQTAYPGYFHITADGGAYSGSATWPGLDSWQMCGAYLLLGRTPLVLDYFDFVRAGQRADGNIPWAVFPGETQADAGCLRALKNPADLFTYEPPVRQGVPESSQQTRPWVGLFEHWQTMGDPLTTLGPICYLLTAAEIFDATHDDAWLRERLPSVELAANYIHSRKSANGLIGGSGFYTESPPRYAWDGVTQCFAIYAFRELARILAQVNDGRAATWRQRADELVQTFTQQFWRDDHFAEYIHPEHGLVDAHGLSDVNWAAIAFAVATLEQTKLLEPRLLADTKDFWLGDMPTQTVTEPHSYAAWESNPTQPCAVPPLNDVAAMGRAWYLEATACVRLGATERLVESARKVCRAGLPDGYWRERYHPTPEGKVAPAGAQKYCEYPAVLVRVVLANRKVFCA